MSIKFVYDDVLCAYVASLSTSVSTAHVERIHRLYRSARVSAARICFGVYIKNLKVKVESVYQ